MTHETGMQKRSIKNRRQYGVLPCSIEQDGSIRIMLITSRETGRWVIPKGWPVPKLKPREAAMREAYEEAGLIGKVLSKSVGSYQYPKRFTSGVSVSCDVKVYLMAVEQQVEAWPEKDQRRTRWFDPLTAASIVDEKGLADIIFTVSKWLCTDARLIHATTP
jgi:8-oxo-dGTP pyrophosphatase MutT (NUDIX family)